MITTSKGMITRYDLEGHDYQDYQDHQGYTAHSIRCLQGISLRHSGLCSARRAQQPENQPTTPNDMHPIAPQRRPFRPHFTYLYRLVLTRSRAPECPKANHFSAHLALLVGPDTLSRPATTPKFPGGAPAGTAGRHGAPSQHLTAHARRTARHPATPPGGGAVLPATQFRAGI